MSEKYFEFMEWFGRFVGRLWSKPVLCLVAVSSRIWKMKKEIPHSRPNKKTLINVFMSSGFRAGYFSPVERKEKF